MKETVRSLRVPIMIGVGKTSGFVHPFRGEYLVQLEPNPDEFQPNRFPQDRFADRKAAIWRGLFHPFSGKTFSSPILSVLVSDV